MKYGLSEKTIQKIHGVFKQYPQIEKVILYGSRATGNYRNGSDIDLTFCSEGLTHSVLTKIDFDLDDLLLPYTIDLSVLSQINNPDMVAQIERVGVNFMRDVSMYNPTPNRKANSANNKLCGRL